MEKIKPLELVIQMSTKMPNIYNDLSQQRQNSMAKWNKDLCYLPINQIADIMAKKHPNKIEWNLDVQILAATAPWRIHKQIFKFSPEMEDILCKQADDIEVPVEILYRLPFQSIYIQTSGFDFDGFFVHFEQDLRDMSIELRLLLCYQDYEYPMFIHLKNGGTILDGIKMARKESQRNVDNGWNPLGFSMDEIKQILDDTEKEHKILVPQLIQLVLYLCAENKEVEENPEHKKIYREPKPNFIKDKPREVKKWDVGKETGIKLRTIYTKHNDISYDKSEIVGNAGSRKSPHMRKAHWHHFWTGKKGTEERHRIIKWIAPVFVNANGETESPFITLSTIKETNNIDE